MLTPQKIEEYSYNRVVDIYNQLSVDICSDIIERVSALGNITQTTEDELRVLLEINGQEIFENVLIKTSMLDDQTKEELRKLYETMVKEDMKDYKPLYEYRDKEFKLTKNQIKILNKGIEENNKVIRNFTNSVAFNSKQTFIDSVDEAYLMAASGAMGYDKAIEHSYKKIAATGLKITDKAGRNVALDVAVRRSILTGIQQTANLINFETGKILGCDGYEVTAHIGARPTHAICQGLQYAEDKETAEKYGIDWWYDTEQVGKPVAELWEEPNCRHTVFPIIVGINEPTYSKQELDEINNATVMLNDKEIPVYEANQEMRKIERNIRNYKREVDTLKQANVDYSKEQQKLKKWQQEYTRVSNETGIPKYYDRIKTYTETLPKYNFIGETKKKVFSDDEIIQLTKQVDYMISKYTDIKGRFSGNIVFDNEHPNAYLPNGDLSLNNNNSAHQILHELLHSKSIGIVKYSDFVDKKYIEEIPVQFFTEEISKKEQLEPVKTPYTKMTDILRTINDNCKINETDYLFAKNLFEVNVNDREKWLENKIGNNKEMLELYDIIRTDKLWDEDLWKRKPKK